MTNVISATPTGDQYIDGILYGTQWAGPITYSFADDFSDFGATYPHSITGFQQVSDIQQNAIQSILEGAVNSGTALFTYGSFTQVSNLDISLAADPFGSSDLTIGGTDQFDGYNLPTARVADFPELSQISSGGDVWFGNDYASYRTPELGSYAWITHIHEFGHAVGLSHGQDAGTTIPGFEFAIPHDRDSMEFSVMTYRSYIGGLTDGYTNETYGYAQTLMMYDIAAIQYLYGADFDTNSGNTVYSWSQTTGELFVDGIGQGAPGGGIGGAANRVFLTIWDGNGKDTYDFSTATDNALIDLSPGGWSLVSQVQRADLGRGAHANGNVYNALQFEGDARSLIENAKGGSGNDEIGGNSAVNILEGNGGDDVLIGKAGSDKLFGGAGADTLYGDFRTPADTYTGTGLFTEISDTTNSTQATARDLSSFIGYHTDANIEHSDVNPSVAISGTGGGSFDWFSFEVKAPGEITIDIDGTMDSYIEFYDAAGNLLAYNEDASNDPGDSTTTNIGYQSFIAYTVTTPGQYFIKVAAYNGFGAGGPPGIAIPVGTTYSLGVVLPNPIDMTSAGSGNDTLDGGDGVDTLVGGAGNDTYVLGADNDIVIDTAGTADRITSTVSRSLASYGTIERLTLLGTDSIDGTGNDLDNLITGNSGDNILDGGAGLDTLSGGAGNDTYVLGAENDTITDSSGAADLITSTITRSLAGYSTIERLTLLGSSNINATGNGLANTLVGNTGDNVLDGGLGADTLSGGSGNDTYVLGAENDTVIDSSGTADRITSTITRSLAGYSAIEQLTLLGSANINATGNGLANILVGNAGNNVLDGGTGADTLSGGGGDDTYVLNAGSDTIIDSAGTADLITSTITRSLAGYSTIERLTLLGSANINATGNGLANILVGNAGNNVLDGGTGADTLSGGGGDDTYVLNAGSDAIIDSVGTADLITSTITRSLASYTTIERLTLLGSANINATGNGLANVLVGNAGNNVLDGGTGADALNGGAGNDTYVLNAGSDTIVDSSGTADRITSTITRSLENYTSIENLVLQGTGNINGTGNNLANALFGNAGNNTLSGGAGADVIAGGSGNDVISGGTGIDTLTGQAGTDTFVFDTKLSISTNIDSITDFTVTDDTIRLDDAIFTALTTLGTLASAAFFKNFTGQAHDASDRIIYETDTGKLFYDSDGTGSGGRIQFATLTTDLALTSNDFIVV
ncbi:M10 family metallopeptidase C-terminal domain-containing protein [Pararhizobium polonicum]|uniref:M10 family metallopeptidase C-terminal domain-containing protein n=1 Tax=Pararhizobium polonicum TaxID=1612624 RepID=UPI00083B5937|nr:pre-peptidase C-terminal domain-containing protein [Pararhizobium polonicum]